VRVANARAGRLIGDRGAATTPSAC
jgi:hypothetical protein